MTHISHSPLTVLRSPITEVVHASDVPSASLVDVGNESTDDGTPQMTGVDWLGDVGRRKVDEHALALSGLVGAIAGHESTVRLV